MVQQTTDWARLKGKTFTTSKGARFKVKRITAKSVTIQPESSTRSYDLSVPNELDRCIAEYALGRFFPSAADLLQVGVRHERNSYVWGILKAVLIDHVLETNPSAPQPKKPTPAKSFAGYWRITSMPNFDDDFLAEGDEPAHLQLNMSKYGEISGQYSFSYSSGMISGESRQFGAETLLIFGFEGNDDTDSVTGAGWATLVASDQMEGEFLNDYSTFTATRSKPPGKVKTRRTPVVGEEGVDADSDDDEDYEGEE